MDFFRNAQANVATSYPKIYRTFNWFLKMALLPIFDDDFMVGPFRKATAYFNVTGIFISINLTLLHMYIYRDNIDTVILCVATYVTGFELLFKIVLMVHQRKAIRSMIDTVLRYQSFPSGSAEAVIYDKYLRFGRKLLFITMVSYVTTCMIMMSYPVLARELHKRTLPFGYSIPFLDYRLDPWYQCNYLLQIVQASWVAFVLVGLDGPFYLFVCYSASQLEILMVYLKQFGEHPENIEEQRQLIRKVFDIHTSLSEFLVRCSDVYREIYLAQVLCSIIHICVPLYHIQLKVKNGSYGMMITNINKIWLFCYCGQLVVSKADEFNTAVYENYWYQLWNRRDLGDVLFMLANAQRHYGISIGGFGFLSFATFTGIMKTAYSCNAFLHQVMN